MFMKKNSILVTIALMIVSLLGANAQDPNLNIDADANAFLNATQTGVIRVRVVEASAGNVPGNRVGVQISTNASYLTFAGAQPTLPSGSTICSNNGGTILIMLPAFSEAIDFNVNITAVSAQADVNISANLEWYDGSGACNAGAPFGDDEDAGNASSAIIDVISATPVNLISFSGKAEGGKAVLDWVTAEETGFSHFVVEKSPDAKAFTAIGQVPAKGSNNSYDFTTDQAEALVYYRLTMVDHDGSSAPSKIIPVALDDSQAPVFMVYPNPTSDYLQVKYKEAGTIRIVDVSGNEVKSQDVESGVNAIDVRNLREGVYFGKFNNRSFKFVKR